MEINGSYFSQNDITELVNLYHLAKTALSGRDDSKYQRRLWASKEFAKANPDYPEIRCYKALERSLA